jgi:hypothetical protein
MSHPDTPETAEDQRLAEDARRDANWKRWGPYLTEREWGTVREDYSPSGDCWGYFPFEHAASRAYRWGEDGLLGITDREGRLCFALALWNGKDPILKERIFGLTNPQGNHGEDVKDAYFYLDATPTSAYLKGLYKYPQAEFPYRRLMEEAGRRGKGDREFELADTGVFDDGRYFDVLAEYAKARPDDILIRVTVTNRGPEPAPLHLLPTLWYRNTWVWGCKHEGCWVKPRMSLPAPNAVDTDHVTLGKFRWVIEPVAGAEPPQILFTDNETNTQAVFNTPNFVPFTKDAFHRYVIRGETGAVNPRNLGTKVAAHYRFIVPAGGSVSVRMRLFAAAHTPTEPFGDAFDATFVKRIAEADEFYATRVPQALDADGKAVARQAYAGLLWSKQFYHYIVRDWLEGDPDQPAPPASRHSGRNSDWGHLFNRDIISTPDKWEYPGPFAWDMAFHMVPIARVDPEFAKHQLMLLLREWYMHPNGQLPAYDYDLSDVNPPVHAWAAWRVYKICGAPEGRDRLFLERVFQKLLLNFTWWVNRKDLTGKNLFSGGFLGLDNIGVFDRSRPLPTGGSLQQADGTAWMAFYCTTMLAMALELAQDRPAYEDMASKFFEHFIAITDSMNTLGGTGLWDEQDGFYYDVLKLDGGASVPLRVRSMVGLIPLFAVEVLDARRNEHLTGFFKRTRWFLENRPELAAQIAYMKSVGTGARRLLAIPSKDRLTRVLRYLLDENEFLSPFGIRSLSKVHQQRPYEFYVGGTTYRVNYIPGESDSGMFGGNSNWRGPIWMPVNYLIIESLERYHHFYGDTLTVEFPTGSGRQLNLREVARELAKRLAKLFKAGPDGRRPWQGGNREWVNADWRDLHLYHEYFDGDTGRGLGASHQTGWTALIARLLEDCARRDE